ncbi:RmlC-like cupin domain-containing protein [Podospora conica]|nr:RmlC-like cupin domain-containing protein [Schizothecium conicum]
MSHLTPSFPLLTPPPPPSPAITTLLTTLNLQPHPEGGFFVETDRDPLLIPSPFPTTTTTNNLPTRRDGFTPHLRNASTTIFYLLTPSSPQGHFHRNRSRTVHTLHRGRGRYVVIHPASATGDGDGEVRVETFVVGGAVEKGERLQWVVEGGRWKGSFLLPDADGGEGSEGLLISETVVPGFEYEDHEFLSAAGLEGLLGEGGGGVGWLVRGG